MRLRRKIGQQIDFLSVVYKNVAKPSPECTALNNTAKVEEKLTAKIDPVNFIMADDSNLVDTKLEPSTVVQDCHHITPQSAADSIYNKAEEGGTKLIRKAKYDEILEHLEIWDTTNPKNRPPEKNNAHQRYTVGSNVEGHQLFRIIKSNKSSRGGVSTKRVVWYETMFNMINEAHLHLGRPKDPRTVKNHLDLQVYDIPETAIRLYRDTCPECIRQSRPPKKERMGLLNLIISETIGIRAQVDLVDLSRRPDGDCKYNLHYVDHHSGFSHVAPLVDRDSETVGLELVKLLSSAFMPDILQSAIGGEFLGECISIIKSHFKTIHIVKGQPRYPQSQGSVERSNGTFKNCLNDRRGENPEGSWAKIGVYVVNAQMNARESRSKDWRSAYEIYYGKHQVTSAAYLLDLTLLSCAQTEYGYTAV
jgi:hypothetical protein